MSLESALEFVGRWEDVSQHAEEFAGRIVRVTVIGPEQSPMKTPAERLPDPPFDTGEIPAPFSLPRPGPGERVETRDGPPRLPDPPIFWSERGLGAKASAVRECL